MKQPTQEAIAVSGTRRSMKELVDGTIRVQIDIDPVHREQFFRLFSQIDMPIALAPLISGATLSNTAVEKKEQKTPNELAKRMHVDGYFRNPRLWDAMDESGMFTQNEHKEFVEHLPCCGKKLASHIQCNGDVVMHHVKTSANSGVGIKPKHWHGVPLCHSHHMTWAHGSHSGSATHEDRHDVLLPFAIQLTADNMKYAMKNWLDIDSLSEITNDKLDEFESEVFGIVINRYRA